MSTAEPTDAPPPSVVEATWDRIAWRAEHHGRAWLRARRADADRLLADHGVSYDPPSVADERSAAVDARDDQSASDRRGRWSLDPVPLVVDEADWRAVARGVAQRARLLDAMADDLYGPRRLLAERTVPPELVLSHPRFTRGASGIALGDRHLVTVSTDLVRRADGGWAVMADQTERSVGAGYAMENRRVVAQVLAGPYRESSIRRIGPYFHALRRSLQELAPRPADTPRVVLLSGGPATRTAYDQAFTAVLLGFPLVEGDDLVVEEGRVWMQTMDRLEPVDVILRGVDTNLCDPLELSGSSTFGVPGLLQAARRGDVAVVNGLGSGVLEHPGLAAYLPKVARALLGEDLLLPSLDTWWCGDDQQRSHVLANLDSLVLRPALAGPEGAVVLGSELSEAQRDHVRRRIEAVPHAWVGQEAADPEPTPTLVDDLLEDRPAWIRSFAVARGDEYQVMSGGLARSTPVWPSLTGADHAVVAKDVWVVTSERYEAGEPFAQHLLANTSFGVQSGISPRAAEDLFWYGRYAERAQGTARLLRAAVDRHNDLQHSTDADAPATLAALHRIVTTVIDGRRAEPDAGSVGWPQGSHGDLAPFVVDRFRTGAVAATVWRMTESANAVRDQLSGDTWSAMSSIERTLGRLRARASGELSDGRGIDLPYALDRLLEAFLALDGLAGESMVRDVGWRLMQVGKRIERAQHLVVVLTAALAQRMTSIVAASVFESVLLAEESIFTYRRRYATRPTGPAAVEILVSDRTNPRSLGYQLQHLALDLQGVPSRRSVEPISGVVASLERELDAIDVAMSDPDASDSTATALGALERAGLDLRRLADEVLATHGLAAPPRRGLDFALSGAGR